MKVAVIGLGKAGLPLAAVIADSGISVVGVDVSPDRVKAVNAGMNPIPEEPLLSELIKRHAGKNLKAVVSVKDAEECTAFIVIVPLFIDQMKKPDFSMLESVFSDLAKVVKDDDLVVLETTVPIGTTSRLGGILSVSGKKFHLAYSPERIMTGYSVSRYREFPKVVGGVDPESGRIAYGLYSKFCREVSLVSSLKAAEMAKIAEGVYRDVNISLANELFKVCEKEGIDYYEMRQNANHEFCNLHLPGNVGGHCIPVYPWFLINNFSVPLIRDARLLNDSMIEFYASRIIVKKGMVLVCGLTFRDGVKELAYTRSLPLIDLLRQKGYDVYACDPMFSRQEIEKLGLKHSENFESMDAIVLMNKCPEYKESLVNLRSKVVDVQGGLR
jgi:UDP-N-acetyl-D-mannosaminuronic acid dehydrogenase